MQSLMSTAAWPKSVQSMAARYLNLVSSPLRSESADKQPTRHATSIRATSLHSPSPSSFPALSPSLSRPPPSLTLTLSRGL
eukprot:1338503-Rhodomonas_salina.2